MISEHLSILFFFSKVPVKSLAGISIGLFFLTDLVDSEFESFVGCMYCGYLLPLHDLLFYSLDVRQGGKVPSCNVF